MRKQKGCNTNYNSSLNTTFTKERDSSGNEEESQSHLEMTPD